MKTQFFKPNVPQKISNMNWSQVKARFPNMNPYGDADKDGLRNKFDCKPFDIKRQGEGHEDYGFKFVYKKDKKEKSAQDIIDELE